MTRNQLTSLLVAERSKVPLFVLTAGDLGINPDKVEKTLNNALECCRLWDAVLLLDEADVFLECRRADSLARNELTSSQYLGQVSIEWQKPGRP